MHIHNHDHNLLSEFDAFLRVTTFTNWQRPKPIIIPRLLHRPRHVPTRKQLRRGKARMPSCQLPTCVRNALQLQYMISRMIWR
jgi:hypothetical protein